MNGRRVALVTGASRGLGKVSALHLAEAGFDVAITARNESGPHGGGPVVPIPGGLDHTAKEIEARGRRALPVRMDLLDRDAVVAAPRTVLAEWGHVDVLVNNAILQGGATMDRVLDLTPEAMTQLVVGNYVHQVLLTQQVVPQMLERGEGRIVNMVSGSVRVDPVAPAGAGGWGIAYSASKAAFGRVAGGINAELGPGIQAYNVDPGNVVTETRRTPGRKDDFEENYGAEPPEATGATVAYLATSAEARSLLGRWIHAPKLARDLGLLG